MSILSVPSRYADLPGQPLEERLGKDPPKRAELAQPGLQSTSLQLLYMSRLDGVPSQTGTDAARSEEESLSVRFQR